MATSKNLSIKTDGLYINDNQITDFVPVVKQICEKLSSNGTQIFYSIEIYKDEKIVSRVDVQDLFINSWFKLSNKCSDATLTNKDRKIIQEHLEKQVAELPVFRKIFITQKGWSHIEDGCAYYINDSIYYRNLQHLSLENKGTIVNVAEFQLKIDYRYSEILNKIETVAAGTSWIIYLVSFFDVLKQPFQKAGFPIEFITNLYGKSGSGKTSLVKTLCGIENCFSFRSSKRKDRMLREIKEYTGHTILVDDFHPSETKADCDRQTSIKDCLVRLVEEEKNSPNIIITSEYLSGHTSLQDREVQLYLEKKIDFETLTFLANNKALLDDIRSAFYSSIITHESEVINYIKSFCSEFDEKDLNDGVFRINRFANYISCIQHLFVKYFAEPNHLEFQYEVLAADLEKHLLHQNKHMQNVVSTEKTFLIAVRDMLLDKNCLQPINDFKMFTPNSNNFYIDSNKHLFITLKALLHGLVLYLQTTDIPIKKIIKELEEIDALVTYDKSSELTKKIRNQRCYEIDTDALNEYCSIYE